MNLLKSSSFKLIDRGYQSTVVLIPGWATDSRLFAHLDLAANYLFATSCVPVDFNEQLMHALDANNLSRVSLFGVSLGGFLAARWAARHVERVEKLVMVGIREQYPAPGIELISRYLVKNKKAYLSRFYAQCFSDAHPMGAFERDLFSKYCETFELEYLLETLAYLKEARIEPAALTGVPDVTIVHGECDRIAPCTEAYEISTQLYNAEFVCVPAAGHFPFLLSGFSKLYDR